MEHISLGTGNSFLRDFGIEHEDAALEALARGTTRGVDVVRVTHAGGLLHYINLLTVGFVTRAGDLTNRRFKVLGDRGYLVAAMIEIARLKLASDPILVDEQPYGDARPACGRRQPALGRASVHVGSAHREGEDAALKRSPCAKRSGWRARLVCIDCLWLFKWLSDRSTK